jgi:hypothetical protein
LVAFLVSTLTLSPYFEELVKNADRVFYFNEGQRAEARIDAKTNLRAECG